MNYLMEIVLGFLVTGFDGNKWGWWKMSFLYIAPDSIGKMILGK